MASLTRPHATATAPAPSPDSTVLTDEMLARFAKRAPTYDRDNCSSPTTSTSCVRPAISALAVPAELGGGAVARRRRAGAAAARLPRRADRAGDQHAPLLDRQRRRSLARRRHVAALAARGGRGRRGVRRRPCRERQRYSGPALDHEGRTSGRRLPVHGPEIVRQPVAGLDVSGHSRHGHGRSVAAEDRPRVHAARDRGLSDRADLGRAGHAGDAERRHHPRRRVRPRSLRRPGRARRRRRHRSVRARALRVGAHRVSATSTSASPAGRST